jgi:hypothetical protein
VLSGEGIDVAAPEIDNHLAMGVTYHLEFDREVADAAFESRAFADASDQLDAVVKELGLPSHFELFSYAAQNDLCDPENQETETPWYDAQAGLDWLERVMKYVRARPDSVPNATDLLTDLVRAHEILQRAKHAGAKWHFAMDF